MKPFKRTTGVILGSLLVVGLVAVFLVGIANAWEPGPFDRRIPRPPSPAAGWWVVQSALQENRCNELGCYAIPGTPLMLNHATSQGGWAREHGVGTDSAPDAGYGVYGLGRRPRCPLPPAPAAPVWAAGQWYLNKFIQFNWDSERWEIQNTLYVFWAEDPCMNQGNIPTPVPTPLPTPTPRPTEQRGCDPWTPPAVQPDFAWRPRDPMVHLPTVFFVSDPAEIYLIEHQARYTLAGYWFDYGDGETGTGAHIYRQTSVFSTLYDGRGNPSYPVVLYSTYGVTYRRTCHISAMVNRFRQNCESPPWRPSDPDAVYAYVYHESCGGSPGDLNRTQGWWREMEEVASYVEDNTVSIPGVPRQHPVPVFQAKGEQW